MTTEAVGTSRIEVLPEPARPSVQRATRAVKVLLAVDLVVAIGYVSWWLVPGRMGTPVLFWLLVAAECFTLFHVLGLWSAIWTTRVTAAPAVTTARTVDVFIPTYGEPLDVLETTIRAAVAMTGDHETYVLDDAVRAEVRDLAERLGARYIARHDNTGAKAGNINNALRRTRGELVAIFDADHVPAPTFLVELLGHFDDQKIAFVQSPQYYGNGDTDAVSRGAYQQQAIFYGPIMRGKNGQDSAFCCGTNVIFRRSALEDVGGLVETSVCEDFVTSMHLHRRGWRSVYHPFVLAQGLGPATLRTYFKQQYRWARGSVGALSTGEPFRRGFTLAQRVQYLLATTFYLVGLVTCVYLVLPPLYLFFGLSPFSTASGSFPFFYAPYLILGLVTIRVALGGRLRLEHLQYTFGTFPVYALASLAALFHVKASFGVTSKGPARSVRPPATAFLPVAVAVITLAGVGYGLFVRPINARTITNVSWSLINVALLSGVCLVALREWRAGRVVPASATAPAVTPFVPTQTAAAVVEREPERMLGLPARRPTRPLRWAPRQIVVALTLLAAVVRLSLINYQSLWLDETLTNQQSHMSIPDLWRFELEQNVHVPLYHTIIHVWTALFGSSAISLRLPSIVFSVGAVPLLYVVGRRIAGQRAALVATAMGAASPFWIWHGTEARMYPLLLLMGLASMATLMAAHDRGGIGRWAAYAAVTGASFYVHYYALLMPVVHLMWLLFERARREKLLAWLGSLVAAGLVFLPWAIAFIAHRIASSDNVTPFTNGIASQAHRDGLTGTVFGFVIFVTVLVVGYHTSWVLALLGGILFGLWPLAAVRAVVSGSFTERARARSNLFLVAWAVWMIGGVYLLDIAKPGAWMQRYLIVAAVPVLLLLAETLTLLFRRHEVVIAAVLVLLLGATAAEFFEPRNPVRQDFRGAISSIESVAHPGDIVLVEPQFNKPAVQYYLTKPGLQVVPVTLHDHSAGVFIAKILPQYLANVPAGGHVWLLTQYEETADPNHTLRRSLDRSLGTVSFRRYGNALRVSEHEVPAGAKVTPIIK